MKSPETHSKPESGRRRPLAIENGLAITYDGRRLLLDSVEIYRADELGGMIAFHLASGTVVSVSFNTGHYNDTREEILRTIVELDGYFATRRKHDAQTIALAFRQSFPRSSVNGDGSVSG